MLKWASVGVCVILLVPYLNASPYANVLLPVHLMIAAFTVLLWVLDGRAGRRSRIKWVGIVASAVLFVLWMLSTTRVVQYVGKAQSIGLGRSCIEYVAIRSKEATPNQIQQMLIFPIVRRYGSAKPGLSYQSYPIKSSPYGWGILLFGLGFELPAIYNDKDFWGVYVGGSDNRRVWFDRFGFLIPLWFVFAMVALPTVYLLYRDFRAIRPGHCRQCGYNLTGNSSGICPECGAKIAG